MSFGRVIRALLAGNVPLQLHFYRMTGDDSYPEEANYVTRTNVQFSMSSGQVDIPTIKVADFDGDGLEDLLMQTDAERLEYRRGVRDDALFDEDATELSIALPRNGELVAVEDLDDNGLADLILRYNESDGDGPSKTLRLLVTR
jgi:hypothetical protein